MKKYLVLMAAAACAVSLSAAPINITIDDGLKDGKFASGSSGIGQGLEDQAVNFSSTWGQNWDLEAFRFDRSTSELQMIGGFNAFANNDQVILGDIFIKMAGEDEYSYAVHFDRVQKPATSTSPEQKYLADKNFTILDLSDASIGYLPVGKVGPYAVATGYASSAVVGTGTFDFGAYTTTEFAGDATNNNHYLMSGINLSSIIGKTDAFYAFQTMTCGNDALLGHVPEPTTLSLLGLGLMGLAFLRRKKSI